MDDRLWITAHHESSHVVMAAALGMSLGSVSIRPGKRHLGVAFSRRLSFPKGQRDRLGPIVPRLPAQIRRSVEYRVMVSLAGNLGEGWAGPPPDAGYSDDADEYRARADLARLTLPPRERATLEAFEASDEPLDGDEADARALALALADDDCVATYLAFLRACTARYVRHEDFGREVRVLVQHLLREETLSGAFCKQLMEEAQP